MTRSGTSEPHRDRHSADAIRTLVHRRVRPAERVRVAGDQVVIPAVEPDGLNAGAALDGLMARWRDCATNPIPRILDPSSMVAHADGRRLTQGVDFSIDPFWGTVGVPPGVEPPRGAVSFDYTYSLHRVDGVMRTAAAELELRHGQPHATAPRPPAPHPGETLVASVYVPHHSDGSQYDIFPVTDRPAVSPRTRGGRLPAALARLLDGRPLRVVCWGDSVTAGGDSSSAEKAYPALLEAALKQRFPAADVQVDAVAVSGSRSVDWLNGGAGDCRWDRVTDADPHVVTIEFVNDGWVPMDVVRDSYREILERLARINAEPLLITPTFLMPEWMPMDDLRAADPRPHSIFWRQLADARGIALADVAGRWEQLWRQGIPFPTMLMNGVNHPDDRGHRIFLEEILACFDAAGPRMSSSAGTDFR